MPNTGVLDGFLLFILTLNKIYLLHIMSQNTIIEGKLWFNLLL